MRTMTQNLLYFGLGAINLTREKARDLVNDLVARGEVEKNEASTLVENLMEKGKAERDELMKMLRGEMSNLVQSMNIVDETRVSALEERIRALEAKTGE
jgi:polyhydroxyalkanoate synthesis regulator phasin